MKSIDLINSAEDIFFHSRVRFLKPDEMFYVRVKSLIDLPELFQKLIQDAAAVSTQVFVSIPAEEFKDTNLTAKYLQMGVKGFALRTTYNVEKWLKFEGIGRHNSGDRDIVDFYNAYKGLLPQGKEVTFEFQLQEDMRVLGPTITGLYQSGVKWLLLNAEGEPDDERASKIKDVLEYLKIRGCARLNVYFPFWTKYFREWDIKTQNTFSGLEFVHIDVSNRCTHSCVFCGLYGAEAQDDIKKRSGGVIPKQMTEYMKMEIEKEKCLNIIQSLPWSIRSIQFGGFGDPLMHDNAVDFITAARKRGFRVEVLSNMEYLDDEQIHQLHALGGYNFHDLHFIMNISAATPETYIKTRPKQTEKSFQKVIHNVSLFSKLRKENNNHGANFTLMCVVTSHNCHELPEIAELAHRLGARRIWFKPLEIHLKGHQQFVPQGEKVAGPMKEALKFAKENKMEIAQESYCEEIIRRYSP